MQNIKKITNWNNQDGKDAKGPISPNYSEG